MHLVINRWYVINLGTSKFLGWDGRETGFGGAKDFLNPVQAKEFVEMYRTKENRLAIFKLEN